MGDSIKIGAPVAYSLTARYPSDLQVLFPDSSHYYYPFEFSSKRYFTTQTNDSVSYDSAVYYLTTFNLDSVSYLGLPVYVPHESDSTVIEATADSIRIVSVIGELPDSVSLQDLALQEILDYERVPTGFAYVVTLFAGGLLLLAGVGTWLLFGKQIQRHYRLRRLRQNHQRFLQDYGTRLTRLNEQANANTAASLIGVWKKYLEQLERAPYTKLTTRETIRLVNNEAIANSLHNIDRSIYGNQQVNLKAFDGLREFADQRYEQKLSEVMHE